MQSLPLGSIRMTRAFVPDGVGKPAQVKALRQEVRRQLAPHQQTFQAGPGTRFILSSGTAEAASSTISTGTTGWSLRMESSFSESWAKMSLPCAIETIEIPFTD